jgi:phosphoglycolate phosphatase-like HAD superfamily hydrolase
LPYEHQIKFNFPENENNEQAIDEFEELKIDQIFEQELFPDAKKTLLELNEMNLDIFVSSSTFQSTIVEYFSQRGLNDLFKEILGYRPGFEKGADHFRHIQSKYEVNSKLMVFVGDSLKDYERSLGFAQFIGKTGIFSSEDFRNIGHKGYVIDKLVELPNLLIRRS